MLEHNSENADTLKERIEKAAAKTRSPKIARDVEPPSLSAMRVGIELCSGVAVGTIMGLLLDRWLETSPLFLLIFFMLGAAGGGLNIYRQATHKNER